MGHIWYVPSRNTGYSKAYGSCILNKIHCECTLKMVQRIRGMEILLSKDSQGTLCRVGRWPGPPRIAWVPIWRNERKVLTEQILRVREAKGQGANFWSQGSSQAEYWVGGLAKASLLKCKPPNDAVCSSNPKESRQRSIPRGWTELVELLFTSSSETYPAAIFCLSSMKFWYILESPEQGFLSKV